MTQRTTLQNKSVHKYFDLLAQALNDAGYDRQVIYEMTDGKIDTSWSSDGVKQVLWKPVMKALTGKESTTEMTTAEVNRVYEELDYRIGQLTGVTVPFPHKDNDDPEVQSYE